MQVPKHLVTLTVVIVLCSSGLVLAVPSQVRAATRSTFTVSGVVIDSTGAPIPHVPMDISSSRGSAGELAGADSSFSFQVPTGGYSVGANAQDYEITGIALTASQSKVTVTGNQTVNFAVPALATVTTTVLDVRGNPVPGAIVYGGENVPGTIGWTVSTGIGGPVYSLWSNDCTTDGTGTCSSKALQNATGWVSVSTPAQLPVLQEVVVGSDPTPVVVSLDYTFRINSTPTLPPGVRGSPYGTQLTVAGGQPPVKWKKLSMLPRA
jgi:hypothetical protein